MPFASMAVLPQVPLSSVQPPASANPMPWLPLASQASYGTTLPPQFLSALSALDERDKSGSCQAQCWQPEAAEVG